jgi:ring-1,2-phenylacetyl-CoA epoxidase subunit PaaE
MATHFYPIRISEVKQETKDCVSLQLQIPEILKPQFQFNAGQHLTFRMTVNGKEIRRNYSLCSSPLEHEWRVAVKRVPGGLFSTWATEVAIAGDVLDVMPPAGHFGTTLVAEQRKNYLAIAAGSGITPILSIIKTTLATEPLSTFALVYGNRYRGSIIFKEALEALKDTYMQRLQLIHILSRERTDADINHGRITGEKLNQLSQKLLPLTSVDEVFLCGPEEMIHAARTFLQDHGVPAERIHFELFNTSAATRQTATVSASAQPEGHVSKITIRMDGVESMFELAQQGASILDAALQQGADLPYACKGGVCCTCRAKLVEGEVSMDVVYGLEPDEIAAGYILTCQSHPKSEAVVVDYDAK